MKTNPLRGSIGLGLMITATGAFASGQFYGLTNPTDSSYSIEVKDISANGHYAVGQMDSNDGYHAFRWSIGGGLADLGTPAGAASSYPSALVAGTNADGSMIVGQSHVGSTYKPLIWKEGVGMSTPSITGDGINAVSADGKYFLSSLNTSTYRSMGSGGTSLGFLPGSNWTYGNDMSDDGQTIIGNSYKPNNKMLPFVWNPSTGIQQLALLNGYESGSAERISRNGKYVTADATNGNGTTPYVWSADGGVQALDLTMENATGGYLDGVGEVTNSGMLFGSYGNHHLHHALAAVWESPTGTQQDLHDWLTSKYNLGSQLAGWDLYSVNATSADGRFLVGNGVYNGVYRGFIVDLNSPVPEPASVAVLGLGLAAFLRKRRR